MCGYSTHIVEAVFKRLVQKGSPPLNRSSHALAVVKNKIYVFGGELLPRTPVDDALHCYDMDKESWEQMRAMGMPPGGRIAPTMCCIGSKLYLFGGRVGKQMGEGAMNDLFCFDTEKNIWINIATKGSPPQARSFHAMTVFEKKFYVFGGCGEKGRLNDLFCFDTETETWEQLPTCDNIAGRGGSSIAIADKALYVVFGFCGKNVDDVFRFDLLTKTWSEVKLVEKIPPRSVFGIVSHNDKFYIFGGELETSALGHEGAGQFSDEMWCFEPKLNKLTKVSVVGDAPMPRGWFPAAILGENMVFFGGLNSDNVRLSDLYSIELPK